MKCPELLPAILFLPLGLVDPRRNGMPLYQTGRRVWHTGAGPLMSSRCPRSCLSMSLCARPCALRSWWNSWWKCRRSFPILRYYSGLRMVVEDQVLVFKVFPLDSVQHRRLPPRNVFLSGLWSRSLTLFQVDVFKAHLLLTLQLVLKNAQMSLVKGFFALFPKLKKKCEVCFALGRSAYLPVTIQRQVPAVLRASWSVWTRRTVAVVCIRRVFMVLCTSRCVPFPGWQAPNARHFGRHAPEGQLPEAYRNIGLFGR